MSNYQNLCNAPSQPILLDAAFKPLSLRAGIELVQLWTQRSHQRQALAELRPEQLQDIGVSAAQVKLEVKKPFWTA